MMHFTTNAIILSLAALAAAKTDFDDCTSFTSTVTAANGDPGNAYATVIWYDPSNLEICEVLDCGGGRAPPKTTKPGCHGYEGTETVLPSFLKYDPADIRQAEETGAAVTTAPTTATPTATGGDKAVTETSSDITAVGTPAAGAEEDGKKGEETGAEGGAAESGFAVPTLASGGSGDVVDESVAARNELAFAVPAVLGSLLLAIMA